MSTSEHTAPTPPTELPKAYVPADAETEITARWTEAGVFHAEPVAMAADILKIAVSELANISERRIELLVNPDLSGLPAFLAPESGVQSGLMIAHVTAAALVSENKVLAHPGSVDSIPTSAGKEDHVSMATSAARQAAASAPASAASAKSDTACAAAMTSMEPEISASAIASAARSLARRRARICSSRASTSPAARAASAPKPRV